MIAVSQPSNPVPPRILSLTCTVDLEPRGKRFTARLVGAGQEWQSSHWARDESPRETLARVEATVTELLKRAGMLA